MPGSHSLFFSHLLHIDFHLFDIIWESNKAQTRYSSLFIPHQAIPEQKDQR